jgi:hypothetical protein
MRGRNGTMATGLWVKAEIPHRGWTCIGVTDLEDDRMTCEMCLVAEIRYVHLMSHDETGLHLQVGCDCAGSMEGDYKRATDRERVFRNRRSRRSRWLKREWRISRSGNEYINSDDCNIVIFRRGPSWSWRIEHASSFVKFPSTIYASNEAAKLSAFDAMIALGITKPWRSVPFQRHLREMRMKLDHDEWNRYSDWLVRDAQTR